MKWLTRDTADTVRDRQRASTSLSLIDLGYSPLSQQCLSISDGSERRVKAGTGAFEASKVDVVSISSGDEFGRRDDSVFADSSGEDYMVSRVSRRVKRRGRRRRDECVPSGMK